MWNNLTHFYGKDEQTVAWLKESLAEAEIDPSRRGETLSLEEFARLSNALEKINQYKKNFLLFMRNNRKFFYVS